MSGRLRVATCSLAGCFGCHMALLDIDERLLVLADRIELDRCPLTDIKSVGPCDVGLIEGGLCNAENVEVLRTFRAQCKILVAVGACAITGGVPALRNGIPLRECLQEVYEQGHGVGDGRIPADIELPLQLDIVRPIHEVVRVDYSLPGCPPPAEAFFHLIDDVLAGRTPRPDAAWLRYD